MGKVNEGNGPNTIDSCSDGSGTTDSESVKRIVVSSVKGGSLRGSELAKIEATVINYNGNDRIDFYYTQDATNPDWIFITTVPFTGTPSPDGNIITTWFRPSNEISFNLPKCSSSSGCKQAVRVVLRSGRDGPRSDGQNKPSSNCAIRDDDDVDDLVFDVLPSYRPQDLCDFETLVTLDTNIAPVGMESQVSTLRVVEVLPGVY